MVSKSMQLWGRTYSLDDMLKCGMVNSKFTNFDVGHTFVVKSLIPVMYYRKTHYGMAKMNGRYILTKIIDRDTLLLFYDATFDRTFGVPADMVIDQMVEFNDISTTTYTFEN